MASSFLQAAGLSQDESNDFLVKAQSRKSGETHKCIDYVDHKVNWPHEKVRRLMGSHADYKDLSLEELMAGSLTIISQGLPTADQYRLIQGQLEYFSCSAIDANEHPWPLVRASHKEVLICLEHSTLDLNNPEVWKLHRQETPLQLKNAPALFAGSRNNASQSASLQNLQLWQKKMTTLKVALVGLMCVLIVSARTEPRTPTLLLTVT